MIGAAVAKEYCTGAAVYTIGVAVAKAYCGTGVATTCELPLQNLHEAGHD
jgi:hypothetical protein